MLAALLNNDPRPFFMRQSSLAGERLAYPVMDGVLSAYHAVYGPSAPILNLPMSGTGRPCATSRSGPRRYAGELSGYTRLGEQSLNLVLNTAPFRR